MTDQDRIAQLEAQVASLVRTVSELVGLLTAKPAQPAVVQTVNPFYVPQPIPSITYYQPPAPIYPQPYFPLPDTYVGDGDLNRRIAGLPLTASATWGSGFAAPAAGTVTLSGSTFLPAGTTTNMPFTFVAGSTTACAAPPFAGTTFIIDNTGSPQ